jgi:predicted amidohydrolase
MYRYLEECRKKGVDIVCFPEMNITGNINPLKYPNAVISRYHSSIQQITDMSFTYQTVIIAGFSEKNYRGKPYVCQFVAKEGKIVGCYRKKSISPGQSKWFSPGTETPVFSYAGINFGLALDSDIDDGMIFNEYSKQSANLVFMSAAPGLHQKQETRDWQSDFEWWRNECRNKLGKYAAKYGIYIAVATQAGSTSDEDFPGGGYVIAPSGNCICESGDWHEGMIVAKVEIN